MPKTVAFFAHYHRFLSAIQTFDERIIIVQDKEKIGTNR